MAAPPLTISRRSALAWTGATTVSTLSLTALLSSTASWAMADKSAVALAAKIGALPATLILSQERWSAEDVEDGLGPILKAATPNIDTRTQPVLVLLPHGETDWDDVPDEDDVFDELAALAEDHTVYLAGSAAVEADDSGDVETIAFLFSPDGELLARVPKVTPDFTSGFTESTSRLFAPVEFPVVETPFGKVGILPGEDLTVPGLVRGSMLGGVELLLNPALHSSAGGVSQAREELPTTLAYENWFTVATATPARRRQGEFETKLPTLTGFFDWQGNTARAQSNESFIQTEIHMEVLRRGRAHISTNRYDNYPLILRDSVYGPVYKHMAETRETRSVPETKSAWLEEATQRIAAQAARATPDNQLLDGYYALMAQPANMSPLPKENRRDALMQNITSALALVEGRARRADSKIVVFPEFCFSGAGYRTVEDVLSASIRFPGPEFDMLSEFAQRHSIYIAGEFLEETKEFPNRVFNTAFLLNDSGDLINKHHKIQCVDVIGTLRDHTPGSIFEQYVEEYGIESLYSVADTPLGKIGHIICFEIIFPEVLRLMASEGAELIVQSTSEGWGNIRPLWHACRRKRAYENMAYLIMSNTGYDITKPKAWRPYGETQFIDFRGTMRDYVPHNGPEVLQAYVDMAALRAARRDPQLNIPIWDEPAVYADAYDQGKAVHNESWTGDPFVFPYKDGTLHHAVQERFYERGVYVRPVGTTETN